MKFDDLINYTLNEGKKKKKKQEKSIIGSTSKPAAKSLSNFKGGAMQSKKDKQKNPKKQRQDWQNKKGYYQEAQEVDGIYDKGLHFRFFDGKEWKNVEISTPEDMAKVGLSTDGKYFDKWTNAIEKVMSQGGKSAVLCDGTLEFYPSEKEAEQRYANCQRLKSMHINR